MLDVQWGGLRIPMDGHLSYDMNPQLVGCKPQARQLHSTVARHSIAHAGQAPCHGDECRHVISRLPAASCSASRRVSVFHVKRPGLATPRPPAVRTLPAVLRETHPTVSSEYPSQVGTHQVGTHRVGTVGMNHPSQLRMPLTMRVRSVSREHTPRNSPTTPAPGTMIRARHVARRFPSLQRQSRRPKNERVTPGRHRSDTAASNRPDLGEPNGSSCRSQVLPRTEADPHGAPTAARRGRPCRSSRLPFARTKPRVHTSDVFDFSPPPAAPRRFVPTKFHGVPSKQYRRVSMLYGPRLLMFVSRETSHARTTCSSFGRSPSASPASRLATADDGRALVSTSVGQNAFAHPTDPRPA